MQVLTGNGREERQLRRALAVVLLCQGILYEIGEILLELVEPRFPAPRLVVAKEGEDHVGPGIGCLEAVLANAVARYESLAVRNGSGAGEPFIRRAERLRTIPRRQFIAGKAKFAEYQFMFREAGLNIGFQPTVVLHAIGEGVADHANMIALLKFQRRCLELSARKNRKERDGRVFHGCTLVAVGKRGDGNYPINEGRRGNGAGPLSRKRLNSQTKTRYC